MRKHERSRLLFFFFFKLRESQHLPWVGKSINVILLHNSSKISHFMCKFVYGVVGGDTAYPCF